MPFAAAALRPIFLDAGPLAKSTFGDRQNHVVFGGAGNHRNDVVAFIETDADNTVGLAAHLANVRMVEADAHAVMRSDENGLFAGNQFGRDQFVVVRNTHGDDAARGGIVEVFQRGLLDLSVARRHHDENIRDRNP